MQTRINFFKTAPQAYNALMELSQFIATTTLDTVHQELIKIRASQINAVRFVLTCIQPKRANTAKRNNASIY